MTATAEVVHDWSTVTWMLSLNNQPCLGAFKETNGGETFETMEQDGIYLISKLRE